VKANRSAWADPHSSNLLPMLGLRRARAALYGDEDSVGPPATAVLSYACGRAAMALIRDDRQIDHH